MPSLFVFATALLLLLANGRPLGDADSSGLGGWVWQGTSWLVGRHLELDATGRMVVGKVLAAFFAALAGSFLFAAVARRHSLADARWAGVALALGTTLAAAAQAFSGEAAATCGVAAALWLWTNAEARDEPALAARAGLPLALAVAFQPSVLPLALVLAVGLVVRWREALLRLPLWAAPGLVLALAGLRSAGTPLTPRASYPDPLVLLASPAKGALVFAPIAIVGIAGLVRAMAGRRTRPWDEPPASLALPLSCALGFAAHLATAAIVGRWDDGVFWGPRTLAPAWPIVLLFLPEGFAALKLLGSVLLLGSFAVQAIGAVSYSGRWDRLNRDSRGELKEPWSLERSPIAFQIHERVARPALLSLSGRRLVVREHAVVGGGATASYVSFAGGRSRPTGSDATMERLRLEGGARIAGERLELSAVGDAFAFSVREGARLRRLELRLVGSGHGTLGFAESGFRHDARWRESRVAGPFRVRFPYRFADSAGPELAVALRAGGPVSLESVALVPPGDPEKVFRLP